MLTRFHKILIGLLVAQLALMVIVLSRGSDDGARKSEPLLAGFDAAKVTRLAVYAKADAKPVELAKQGTSWVVASSYDYPVAANKVPDLLAQLAKLSADAPIATQASRHKQLHVDDTEFDKKLVLTIDGKPTTLYVGGSAGPRRFAVRFAGDDKVYAVAGISPWTIGGEPREWVDTSYVNVNKDELAKVTIEHAGTTVELEHDGDHWKPSYTLAKGETFDTAAIDRVVDAASRIDLTAPGDPKRDATKPTATITLTRKAQGASSPAPVIVDVIEDGASYWVHDRAQPRAILVDKARLSPAVDAAREKLVKPPPPPEAAKPATPATKAS